MKNLTTLLCFVLITACSSEGQSDNGFGKNPTPPPNPYVKYSVQKELKKISVGLTYKNRAFCSGTIISDSEILTAAHCLGYKMKSRYEDIKIGFGADLRKPKYTRDIEEVILHETYNNEEAKVKPYWDLAIVRFQGGLPHGFKAAPFYKGNINDLELSEAYMSGFGLESAFNKKNSKFKSSKGRLSKIPKIGYLEGFMRVEFKKRGACFGDSGGGLFVKIGKKLYLIGATSGVSADMNPKVLDNLGDIAVGEKDVCRLGDTTYTNLATYSAWINENSRAHVTMTSDSDVQSIKFPKNLYDWCHNKKLSMDSRVFLNRMVKKIGVGICQKDYQFNSMGGSQKLVIDGDTKLDLEILEHTPFFESIKLLNVNVSQWPAMDKHKLLTQVTIERSELGDLEGLALAPKIKKLNFHDIDLKEEHFETVGSLRNLKALGIYNSTLASLEPISSLQMLQKLVISESDLKTIDFIESLHSLRLLVLTDNRIQDLEPMRGLQNLEEAYLDNNRIKDISVLAELNNLLVLSIFGNPIDSSTCAFGSEDPISCNDL